MTPRLVRVAVALGFAVLGAGYLVHAAQHGTWQVDDAGITFAYARNLAAGHGPVTNPGDAVPNEGYSNPAWTFLLALTMAAGAFDLVWTPKVLSAGFALATFAGLAWLVRGVDGGGPGPRTWLPTAALVANGSWVAWSVGGLENAQYVACIVVALGLYVRDADRPDRWPWSGPVFFVVAISRPEGLIYTVLVGVEALVRAARTARWRWLGRLVAGVAVPLAVYLAVHVAVFGDVLPNTYYAKARDTSVLVRLLDPRAGGWRYLLDGLSTWHQAPMLALGLVALADREAWRRGLGAVVAALAGSVVFVLQSGGDWMMQFRFLSPTYALIAAMAALGLGTLARSVLPGRPRARAGMGAVLGVAAVAWVAVPLPRELDAMTARPTVPLEDRLTRLPRLLGILDGLGVEAPVILMSDMGGPMWVNDDGRVVLIDMFGLCTRPIALALHDRDIDRLWELGLEAPAPHVLQVPPTLYRTWRLGRAPAFRDRYVPLDDWRAADVPTGFFLRRDLVEAAWDPSFATGEVVVQRPLRVHRVTLDDQDADAVTATLYVSLRTATSVVPRVRLAVVGEDVHDVVVPVLPMLRPTALRPDTVYRHTVRLPVPDAVGEVRDVRAVGTSERSTLPPPPRFEEVPLAWVQGGEVGEDVVRGRPDDVRVDGGRLVFSPDAATDNRLCTPSVAATGVLRLATTLTAPVIAGELALDLRWFDDDGGFLGRDKAWSWRTPWTRPRRFALDLEVPEDATSARACWIFVDGGGTLTVEGGTWRRPVRGRER